MKEISEAFQLFYSGNENTVLLLDPKKEIIGVLDNQNLLDSAHAHPDHLESLAPHIGGKENVKALQELLAESEKTANLNGVVTLNHREIPKYIKIEVERIEKQGQNYFILKLSEKHILDLLSEAYVSADGLFPSLINEIITGIFILDTKGKICFANQSARQLIDVESDEVHGRSLWDFSNLDEVKKEKELFEELINTGKRYAIEKRFNSLAGREKWAAVQCAKVNVYGISEFIQYSITDITKLRKTLAMLEEQSSLYSDLVEHAPVGIVVHQEGIVKFVNREVVRSMGFDSPEELLGKAIDDFIYKEDKSVVKGRIGEMLTNDKLIRQTEERLIRKDGSIMHAMGSANRVIYNGKPAVQAIFSDITEQKKIENDRLRLIKQQEKHNKDLQEFAYVVSHNLRSPVSSILGLVDLAFMNPDDATLMQEVMGRLRKTSKELNTVIEDLSEILIARKRGSNPKNPVDLEEVLYPVLTVLSREIEESSTKIHYDFSKVPEIMAIKSYLNNIFFNLIQNAIKYSKPNEAPRIEINTWREEDKVILRIRDFGLGIDMEASDRIFGLYQRFHTHKEGRGMGLYLVKSQIESMGAEIEIQSAIGKGTTFLITFYE